MRSSQVFSGEGTVILKTLTKQRKATWLPGLGGTAKKKGKILDRIRKTDSRR